MAKYSTGNSSGQKDNSCQLCGETEKPLTEAKMEGATITVCKDCEPDSAHREDNVAEKSSKKTGSNSRKKTQSTTSSDGPGGYTITNPNPDWVDGVSYGNTETPYMQTNYAETFTTALKENDLTKEEIADELDIPLSDLEALENGNVLTEEVGGKVIETVEELLNCELAENV